MTTTHRLALALGAVYFIWGTTYFAVRVGLESIPPFLLASVRFTIAGLLLCLVSRARGWRATTRADWRHATLLGLTLVTVSAGVTAWSMTTVDSGTAALLASLTPGWILLIDSVSRRRVPGRRAQVGLAAGFAASLVLVGPGGTADLSGGAALMFAGVAWAFGSSFGQRNASSLPTLQSTGMFMLIGGLCLLPVSLLAGEASSLTAFELSTRSALALGYLTIFGSIVVLCAYAWLLRSASAGTVASHAYVNPAIAVVIGVAAGGETASPAIGVALSLSLLAVACLVGAERSP